MNLTSVCVSVPSGDHECRGSARRGLMSAVKAISYEKSGGLSVNAKRWMKW